MTDGYDVISTERHDARVTARRRTCDGGWLVSSVCIKCGRRSTGAVATEGNEPSLGELLTLQIRRVVRRDG